MCPTMCFGTANRCGMTPVLAETIASALPIGFDDVDVHVSLDGSFAFAEAVAS